MKIERALISVSDKTGISELAQFLSESGVEILSTGGTAKALIGAGIPVIEVSDYTGFPEMMDGRVKTLHPKIHGGILNVRDNPDHQRAKDNHRIGNIDMVVVNLYPFQETIAKPNVTFDEAIENIDIGGPSMIRAAAKNFKFVTVVVDPGDYKKVVEDMERNDGGTSEVLRFYLTRKVFLLTSTYDLAIYHYLGRWGKMTEEHFQRGERLLGNYGS